MRCLSFNEIINVSGGQDAEEIPAKRKGRGVPLDRIVVEGVMCSASLATALGSRGVSLVTNGAMALASCYVFDRDMGMPTNSAPITPLGWGAVNYGMSIGESALSQVLSGGGVMYLGAEDRCS